jgi:hypothetical protein
VRHGKRTGVIALATSAVAAMGLSFPSTASAATTYSSDTCSAASNARCVMVMYNSGHNSVWNSNCFLSNINIPDYTGRTSAGTTTYYVFGYHELVYDLYYGVNDCRDTSGDGLPVKNDAAAVGNNLSGGTVYIHYNSGYGGAEQKFDPGKNNDLNATLKNENASQSIVY